jgi:hypothetical protein
MNRQRSSGDGGQDRRRSDRSRRQRERIRQHCLMRTRLWFLGIVMPVTRRKVLRFAARLKSTGRNALNRGKHHHQREPDDQFRPHSVPSLTSLTRCRAGLQSRAITECETRTHPLPHPPSPQIPERPRTRAPCAACFRSHPADPESHSHEPPQCHLRDSEPSP